MMTYEFQVTLNGTGETEGEAWTDAVDSFCTDPGEPSAVRILDDDDDYDEVEGDPSNTQTWEDGEVFTVILLRPDYATTTYGQDTYADYVEAVDVNQAILLARQGCATQDGRDSEFGFDEDEFIQYCNDLHVLYVIKGKAEFIQQ